MRNYLSIALCSLLFTSCASLSPNLEIDNNKYLDTPLKTLDDEQRVLSLDEFIVDENLKNIIDIVLKNNKDIQIALLNIEASKALYRVEESALYPKVDANGGFSREKRDSTISNNYKANLSLSYEIDLFGKIRSLNESAKNRFLATKYAQETTKLSLISQTVSSYLSLLENIELLKTFKDLETNLNSVYTLIDKKQSLGSVSKDEKLSSFASLKEVENSILEYKINIEKDINSIELLSSQKFDLDLKNIDLNSKILEDSKSGIASNVLLQRPDIIESEYKLRAKNANIGAARAAFFPSISLTALGGFANPSLSSLFENSSRTWSFSPSISIPIFNMGENRAKLKYSEIETQKALLEYEKSIETAFYEVNNILSTKKSISIRINNQEDIVKALEESYTIALKSYKVGYGTYLNMLISQREYINSLKTLKSLKYLELENKNELFKALGGKF